MSADRHFGLSAPPIIKRRKLRAFPAWVMVPLTLVAIIGGIGVALLVYQIAVNYTR